MSEYLIHLQKIAESVGELVEQDVITSEQRDRVLTGCDALGIRMMIAASNILLLNEAPSTNQLHSVRQFAVRLRVLVTLMESLDEQVIALQQAAHKIKGDKEAAEAVKQLFKDTGTNPPEEEGADES